MMNMPTMLRAFRTTISGGGEKPSYEMVFKFASMEEMHAADDEWHSYRAALAALPSQADVVERVAAIEEALLAVVSATRRYLPLDGIGVTDFVSLVIGTIDNPKINPIIAEIENGRS